jgi:hypothetical protein
MSTISDNLQRISSGVHGAFNSAQHTSGCLLKLDLQGAAASMKTQSGQMFAAGRALQDLMPAAQAVNTLTGGALAKLQDKGASLSQKFCDGMIDAGMGSLQDMKSGSSEMLKGTLTLDPQRAAAGSERLARGAVTAAEFASGEGILAVSAQVGAGVVADEVGQQARKRLDPNGNSALGGAAASLLQGGSQLGLEALAASRGKPGTAPR